jgi:T5SS/PEP-CTERM-associated repeat protein
VGDRGVGTLTINAGGLLETSGGALAGNSDSGVGTINIDGANSSWTSTGDVVLARHGEAIVNITGGAHATLATTYIGPVLETSILGPGMGKVTVSGGNSQLSAGTIAIGGRADGGGSGELDVSAGGLVQSTGPQLHIGTSGEGTVSITSGGRIEAVNSRIGSGVIGPAVGIASVSGAGSKWTNTGNLDVGFSQGTLIISDGGLVQNVDGGIGGGVLFTPGVGLVTVTGAATEWKNTGKLTVGIGGTGTQHLRQCSRPQRQWNHRLP